RIQRGEYVSFLFYVVNNFHLFEDDEYEAVKELLEKLFNKGCELEQRDRFGNTALLAVSGMLWNNSCEVIDNSEEADTVSFEAGRLEELVQLLLEHGAAHEAINPSGNTPLILVSPNSRVSVIPKLLELGADVHRRNVKGGDAIE